MTPAIASARRSDPCVKDDREMIPAPAFLRQPTGSLTAAFLVVVAWRLLTTFLGLLRGFSWEGLIASLSFLAVAALALLPFWVALWLRPRFGWSSRRTHLLGFAGFAAIHLPLWLYDRATIFGDPAFFDRFMLGVAAFATLAGAASHGHNLQAEGRLHWPERWLWRVGVTGAVAAILLATLLPGAAHTPAFGTGLGSFAEPVVVPGSASSWAILQRLGPGDVAHFARDYAPGERVVAGAVLLATRDSVASAFRPAVAVAGPGLPPPSQALPEALPRGWGAVVNATWTERSWERFAEVPILGMPNHDFAAPAAGRYLILVWDPGGAPGQVWLALGYGEEGSFASIHTFPAAYLALHAEFWETDHLEPQP